MRCSVAGLLHDRRTATCPGSEFWAANYAKIKEANMTLPILLRESANTSAKLTATYGAHGSNAAPRRSPP